MSYILSSSSGGGIATPVSIANGGTGMQDGKDALANLAVDGGGVAEVVQSLCNPLWGSPLILDPDPSIAVVQILDFLNQLAVCNQ